MDPASDPPPPRGTLPPAWYEAAMGAARRGPRSGRAFAAVLEQVFDSPFDGELREEASRLATWLRSSPETRPG